MSKITIPVQQVVAEVNAWPDTVQVVVSAEEGNLTIPQATQLISELTLAIDTAPFLDYRDTEDGAEIFDTRTGIAV